MRANTALLLVLVALALAAAPLARASVGEPVILAAADAAAADDAASADDEPADDSNGAVRSSSSSTSTSSDNNNADDSSLPAGVAEALRLIPSGALKFAPQPEEPRARAALQSAAWRAAARSGARRQKRVPCEMVVELDPSAVEAEAAAAAADGAASASAGAANEPEATARARRALRGAARVLSRAATPSTRSSAAPVAASVAAAIADLEVDLIRAPTAGDDGGSNGGAARSADGSGSSSSSHDGTVVVARVKGCDAKKDRALPRVARALAGAQGVRYAEPNWVYERLAASNDYYFKRGNMWGLYGPAPSGGSGAAKEAAFDAAPADSGAKKPGAKPGKKPGAYSQFGVNAPKAWANGHYDCSSVYVGIVDEGYDWTHPDFAGNLGTNAREIPNNGVDDDGNGFVDDVYGWDFAANDASVYDGSGTPSGNGRPAVDAHGTHVAGTIGAAGTNRIGSVGVCMKAKVIMAKFLGAGGGTTANAVRAFDYLIALKKAGTRIVAINNSWGGGGYSSALYAAIERAKAADILVVVAAGNARRDNDAAPSYPASYPNDNVLTVAAIDASGALATFSNWGAKSVDIAAPGDSILSLYPGGTYAFLSGTSMAAPHVSGAAALWAAYHPGATAAEIKDAILKSAVPTPSLAGKVASGGRLSVAGF